MRACHALFTTTAVANCCYVRVPWGHQQHYYQNNLSDKIATSTPLVMGTNEYDDDDVEEDLNAGKAGEEDEIVIHAGMTPWQKATAFFGPGLLIATVYIDPGQIVVDMETGSAFQYRMLWAMLAANAMGLMFQHLCSRLAIVTGRNLAVECRLEYPRAMRIFLWLSLIHI